MDYSAMKATDSDLMKTEEVLDKSNDREKEKLTDQVLDKKV